MMTFLVILAVFFLARKIIRFGKAHPEHMSHAAAIFRDFCMYR